MKKFFEYLKEAQQLEPPPDSGQSRGDDMEDVSFAETPDFDFKNRMCDLINDLSDWIQENRDKSKEIINHILNFHTNLEHENEKAEKIINNRQQYGGYLMNYNRVISTLEKFQGPPSNLDPLLDELMENLNSLCQFIQTEVEL